MIRWMEKAIISKLVTYIVCYYTLKILQVTHATDTCLQLEIAYIQHHGDDMTMPSYRVQPQQHRIRMFLIRRRDQLRHFVEARTMTRGQICAVVHSFRAVRDSWKKSRPYRCDMIQSIFDRPTIRLNSDDCFLRYYHM